MGTKAATLQRLQLLLVLTAAAAAAGARGDPCPDPDCGAKQICAPAEASEAGKAQWISKWGPWRDACKASVNYNGSIYKVPGLLWTQTTYMQPQMHPYDRFFWDPVAANYTVDRYLEDLDTRYGGIDSVLVWPTYTNIGMDDRNQFDMIRAMPGGVEGLKRLVDTFHSKGIKVLWPYHPWDVGTRREGKPDPDAMADLIAQTGADGFNGDTMTAIDESFYLSALAEGHAIALEAEGEGDIPGLNYVTLGWGEGYQYPFKPAVCKFKWIESRRMVNICNRWAKDHTDDLQFAFFNGIGFETWENVWGTWNGIVPRDGEAIRRTATLLRFFGGAGFLQSSTWTPYYPTANNASVFASVFPVNESRLWLLVNRADTNLTGVQLTIDVPTSAGECPRDPGAHLEQRWDMWDVWHGTRLKAAGAACRAGSTSAALSFDIEARGFGAVLVRPAASSPPSKFDARVEQLVSEMSKLSASGLLASFDDTWQYLPQELLRADSVSAADPTAAGGDSPAGTVDVPRGVFHFVTSGVEIEGDDAHGVDVQYPWEMSPRREHDQWLTVPEMYVHKYPVTCAQFADFLKETGYKPDDDTSFLKNWDGGSYPAGYASKPVTYVSLKDAQSYCSHVGMRLPEAWEWQYAAQGTDGRLYPWGNENDTSRYPPLSQANDAPGPEDVTVYAQNGSSPFGVADLIGNVWQYTSVFQDAHTRAVVVRGSSNYRPAGSEWYFPRAVPLNTHNKYFLFSDGYERASTLGFRCVQEKGTVLPDSCPIARICGALTPPAAVADLSAAGILDWLHAADGSRAAAPAPEASIGKISSRDVHGKPLTPQIFGNNPTGFTWSGGSSVLKQPTPATDGVFLSSQGASFTVDVQMIPAATTGTTTFEVIAYVGSFEASAALTATLSVDGDASDKFEDSHIGSSTGTQTAAFALRVTVASGSRATLSLRWAHIASLSDGEGSNGNITFQAVTVRKVDGRGSKAPGEGRN